MGRFKRHNPGCKCCISPSECALCDVVTPDTITVTFTGFTNSTCTNCADLNATFILTQTALNECGWDYEDTDFCTVGGGPIRLYIYAFLYTDFTYTIWECWVSLGSLVSVHVFRLETDPGTLDCEAQYSLPLVGQQVPPYCNSGSATCTLN